MVKYIFVHPVKGQIFGEASGQTSPLILTLRLWVVGIFSVIVEISVQLDVSLSAFKLAHLGAYELVWGSLMSHILRAITEEETLPLKGTF